MPIKNTKAKGTVLENEFKRYFIKFGYLTTRAAGSFGIDLIALKHIGLKGHVYPLLINVKWKRNYCGPAERKQLIQDADSVRGLPILAYKHIPKGKKNGRHCLEFLENHHIKEPIILPHIENNPEDTFNSEMGRLPF